MPTPTHQQVGPNPSPPAENASSDLICQPCEPTHPGAKRSPAVMEGEHQASYFEEREGGQINQPCRVGPDPFPPAEVASSKILCQPCGSAPGAKGPPVQMEGEQPILHEDNGNRNGMGGNAINPSSGLAPIHQPQTNGSGVRSAVGKAGIGLAELAATKETYNNVSKFGTNDNGTEADPIDELALSVKSSTTNMISKQESTECNGIGYSDKDELVPTVSSSDVISSAKEQMKKKESADQQVGVDASALKSSELPSVIADSIVARDEPPDNKMNSGTEQMKKDKAEDQQVGVIDFSALQSSELPNDTANSMVDMEEPRGNKKYSGMEQVKNAEAPDQQVEAIDTSALQSSELPHATADAIVANEEPLGNKKNSGVDHMKNTEDQQVGAIDTSALQSSDLPNATADAMVAREERTDDRKNSGANSEESALLASDGVPLESNEKAHEEMVLPVANSAPSIHEPSKDGADTMEANNVPSAAENTSSENAQVDSHVHNTESQEGAFAFDDESATDSKKNLAMGEKSQPQTANGTSPLKSNDEGKDVADASAVTEKDKPATSETPLSVPVGGNVLPGRTEKADQSEGIPVDVAVAKINDSSLPCSISMLAPPKQLLDGLGNPIKVNQNDVFLSMEDSTYKTVMYEQFRKLGVGKAAEETKSANELLERFKNGGGRFYKKSGRGSPYEVVDEKTALEKITRDVKRRKQWSKQWLQKEETCNSDSANIGRSTRKRSRPIIFSEAQGQDFVLQDVLRRQSAAAKKKKNLKTKRKVFSANENREFELGCTRYGWGNWNLVQQLVPGKTSEECEEHAAMIIAQFPDMKARLEKEHKEIWVYPDRKGKASGATGSTEQLQQISAPTKLPPSDTGEEVSELDSTVKGTYKTKHENGISSEDASDQPTGGASKGAKSKGRQNKGSNDTADAHGASGSKPSLSRGKSKHRQGKDDEFANHDIEIPKKAAVRARAKRNTLDTKSNAPENNPEESMTKEIRGRPKRQSAINARKVLAASGSGNESDNATVESRHPTDSSRSAGPSMQKAKLKQKNDALLKGLPTSHNGQFYEEESAWRFHNPDFPEKSEEQLTSVRNDFLEHMPARTSSKKLQPLPPAPPLPSLPKTIFCNWTFDEKSRVLLANFRDAPYTLENKKVKVTREDESFLLHMMERDDVTVISEGLADGLSPSLWNRQYIEGCIGSEFHHKVRVFKTNPQPQGVQEKQPDEQAKEMEGWYSMRVSDYFHYLEQRTSVKKNKLESIIEKENEGLGLNKLFSFTDSNGDTKSVDVGNEALYMIDLDLVKLLPQAFEDLKSNFKLPGMLPGGSHCMMNAVNANGRPFMGPNLYITPPFSFTYFHQDGHGTVDSGHLCLSGYNEVVMLRRLTERHKCHAIQLLTGVSDTYNTLYGLPHRDGLENQPGWPSKEAIHQCEKMGYCPSVFVLKAGQIVHINKGRLHAFRKLAPSPLPDADCHHDLRNEILQRKEHMTEDVCFSIAWDWMFKGVTSEGINREVAGILECSRLNREHHLQSLAIPETSLLFLAKENIAKHQVNLNATAATTNQLFALDIPTHQPRGKRSEPDAETVLRGILPSLQYVVSRHTSAVTFSSTWAEKTKDVIDSWRVSIESKPNTEENPDTFALDPYGSGDFFCKFCSEELSNVYMHCDGCEKLLDKDFNICSTCHMDGKYKVNYQMHPFNEKTHSILNHTGKRKFLRRARCPCKNGKECQYCTFCTGCSCRCHQWFTLHYRFMGLENELEILQKAESIVGSDAIPQTAETKARLLSLLSEYSPEENQSSPGIFCQVIDAKRPAKQGNAAEDNSMDQKPSSQPTAAAASAEGKLVCRGEERLGDGRKKKKIRPNDSGSTVEEHVGKKSDAKQHMTKKENGRKFKTAANEGAANDVASDAAPTISNEVASNTTAATVADKDVANNATKEAKATGPAPLSGADKVFAEQFDQVVVNVLYKSFRDELQNYPFVWSKVYDRLVTAIMQQYKEEHVTLTSDQVAGLREKLSLSSSNEWRKRRVKAARELIDIDGKKRRGEKRKKYGEVDASVLGTVKKGKTTDGSQAPLSGADKVFAQQLDQVVVNVLYKSFQDELQNYPFVWAKFYEKLMTAISQQYKEEHVALTSDQVAVLREKLSLSSSNDWRKRRVKAARERVDIDGNKREGEKRKRDGEVDASVLGTMKENVSEDNGNSKASNQSNVKFSCPKCGKDFSFGCVNTAPTKFRSHVEWCKTHPENKRERSKARRSSGGSDDESLNEDRTPFNPDELKPGDSVIAKCGSGNNWQATIRRRHVKKGKPGFMIHYTGNKKSREDWVPIERVVGFHRIV